jgi:heme-degrading monooxygenase HmoA
MIIREWRGRASPDNTEAYPTHFRSNVLPELREVPGFLGAHLSRRRHGDLVEFLVLTRWESLDAIRAFAGEDIGRAVVEPGAIAALVEYDPRVQHYDVLETV